MDTIRKGVPVDIQFSGLPVHRDLADDAPPVWRQSAAEVARENAKGHRYPSGLAAPPRVDVKDKVVAEESIPSFLLELSRTLGPGPIKLVEVQPLPLPSGPLLLQALNVGAGQSRPSSFHSDVAAAYAATRVEGDGEVDLIAFGNRIKSGATVQVAGPQHAGLKEESRLFHGRPVPGGRRSPRDGRSGVKGLFPAPRDPATNVLEWDAQDSLWWLENHCGF